MGGVVRPVALTGADQTIASGPGFYRGLILRETAGAAASVRVYDGTSAAGTIIDAHVLAANDAEQSFFDPPLRVEVGIFVDIIAGTVEGSARVG